MCQDLPLGWLDCLFGVCSAKTETLAVVHELFFYDMPMQRELDFDVAWYMLLCAHY